MVNKLSRFFTRQLSRRPRSNDPACRTLPRTDVSCGFRVALGTPRRASAYGQAKLGIQLAHAGRKASTGAPWDARKSLDPEHGGWQPVAPSAVAMGEGELLPRALTRAEIKLLVAKFADSTHRAERIGFDAIELHSAHGYLMHEFLSPLSNRREDEYGGSLANRMRFPLEVFSAVRGAWPEG